MERVHFEAPTSYSDLRVILANTTAERHDNYAIAYKTQYGETRVVSWLTKGEANRRASVLRRRGYRVVAGLMDV